MRNSNNGVGRWVMGLALGGAAGGAAGATNAELEQRVGELESRLEAMGAAVDAGMGGHGRSGATSIGGYGELHYNHLDDKKEIDFHRFVLFFGHAFNDRISFHGELELEHAVAGDGKKGEIELEQAYVDFQINEQHSVQGGLFLIPVGILNETHEPPTFYGVERNPVEKNIIPTTWWEGGVGLQGSPAPGWSYNLALTSGLMVDPAKLDIRGGRQKVSEAEAEELAVSGRVKWTGMPGVELAAALFYQDDLSQAGGDGLESGLLTEVHAVIERGPFGLRALYARWDLDGSAPEAAGKDEQTGWYIEPAYRVNEQVGVFARFSAWDTAAGSSADTEKEQAVVGVNYWPHPDVVVKFDYQEETGDADGYNLGIGYQF